MIAKMSKVYVVSLAAEKKPLLEALRRLGVLHLQPVEPGKAHADEKTLSAIGRLARAEQILAGISAEGEQAQVEPLEGADRVLELYGQAQDERSRLAALQREADQLAIWGNVRTEQFHALRESGIDVEFFRLPAEDLPQVQAEAVAVVADLPGKMVLAAVAGHAEQGRQVPESAIPLELPARDRPTVLAEARKIDESLKAQAVELASLKPLAGEMERLRAKLEDEAQFVAAERSGLIGQDLYGVQGWVPADEVDALRRGLHDAGIAAAIETTEVSEEDEPPTLIRYPGWARPIKGLFDMLGTFPGYREYDLSAFFMIALPVFAAMLIGDAGYGLLFLLLPLLTYRKLAPKLGRPTTNLVIVFGGATLAWGILTANYFGVTPKDIASVAGFTMTTEAGLVVPDVQSMLEADGGGWVAVGKAMMSAAVLYRIDDEAARNVIIMASFLLGSLHLIVAQLRQALAVAPNIRFVANIGWSLFLAGMLGVVWMLFFPDQIWMQQNAMFGLLIGGGVLVVLFSYPSRNPGKMLALGIVGNILPMISTFSDTMSYIRLMAVGMASYYIAVSFNLLAAQVAGSATWAAGIPILLFGHGLNIALALIAIFAHGVRLNMLEFSNNAGVQWAGYAYAPFGRSEQ